MYLVCAKQSSWENIPLETFSQSTSLMVLWSRDCRPPPTEESPQSTWTLATPTVTLWLFSLETAGLNIRFWIFMIWEEIVNWKVEPGLFTELTLYVLFVQTSIITLSLEIDLSARLGEVAVDRCFSTLGGIILSISEGLSNNFSKINQIYNTGGQGDGLKMYRILYLSVDCDWDHSDSVMTQQCEVAQSCLLAGDLTSIIHSHRVSNQGNVIALLQNFIWFWNKLVWYFFFNAIPIVFIWWFLSI